MRLSRMMHLVVITVATLAFAERVSAQSTTEWQYTVGLRSSCMLSEMPLSRLGNGFADLSPGGKPLPHSSSIFVLWSLGEHARLGIETLVGNAYPESDTQMLFQASGVTAEYQTSGTWFAAVSVQAGGIIVSATQSSDADTEGDALRTGVHYKESGMFFAPQISVGRQFRRLDVRLVGKQVWNFGADGQNAFDGFYAGLSVGLIKR